MITLGTDSVRIGDTLRLSWTLPPGAKPLQGLRGDDSIAISGDSLHPGTWLLQPLAVGFRGGDTLKAIAPKGDTISDVVPEWRVMPALGPADTAVASLLAPRDVPVPLPWREIGIGTGILALVALAIWQWIRWRSRRPPPPPPPVPKRSAHDRIRESLEKLEALSKGGEPARNVAFQAGTLLRELHGELLDWHDATDSTSGEWRDQISKRLPETLDAVRWFLDEADPIRYADDLRAADELLRRAFAVLEATPMREG